MEIRTKPTEKNGLVIHTTSRSMQIDQVIFPPLFSVISKIHKLEWIAVDIAPVLIAHGDVVIPAWIFLVKLSDNIYV